MSVDTKTQAGAEQGVTQAQLYPWQQQPWDNLVSRSKNQNIPHGLLLTGHSGNGKYAFARNFAKYLLCVNKQQNSQPCNQCQPCDWFDNNAHPDMNEIFPQGKAEVIKVDQIRELCQKLSLTSHGSGYQIAIIYPAERMNVNAANSLLKSLEEPGRDTLFILVSDHPGELPATIRSRCQTITMATPSFEGASDWLQQQGISGPQHIQSLLSIASGAPLAALRIENEKYLEQRAALIHELTEVISNQTQLVPTAEKWSKQDMNLVCQWLLSWVNDMIKMRFNLDQGCLRNLDVQKQLINLNNKLNLTLLFKVHDQLFLAQQSLNRSANRQMLAESILLSWI